MWCRVRNMPASIGGAGSASSYWAVGLLAGLATDAVCRELGGCFGGRQLQPQVRFPGLAQVGGM